MENGLFLQVVSEGRQFEAPLHFLAYGPDCEVLAVSIIGYETAVKAILAGIIERRPVSISDSRINPPERGMLFRQIIRPVGVGDVFHGMLIPRHSVWNDIADDEADHNTHVRPIIFAPDGNVARAVSHFLRRKYALTDQFVDWEQKYYEIAVQIGVTPIDVWINPTFEEVWGDLKVVQLDVTEEEILELIEERMKRPHDSDGLTLKPAKDILNGTFDPSMATTKEFVMANVNTLATKLDELQPHHEPSKPLHWSIRLMKRTPFPAQAHKIQGFVNAFMAGQRSVFDGGDMGTGKSICLLGTIKVFHEIKKERGRNKGTTVLLSAPAITVPKWKNQEIKATLPDAKVEIIDSTEEALRLLRKIRNGHKPKKDEIEFYLIGLDRSKLGHDPYFAGIWKRKKGEKKYGWHCPDCFGLLMIPERKGAFNVNDMKPVEFTDVVREGNKPSIADIKEARKKGTLTGYFISGGKKELGDDYLLANGLPKSANIRWKTQFKLKKCPHCGASLWRPALKNRGETRNRPRYNISRILKKSKKWFDFFVQDEVQQTKAEDSGRGDAFAQMVKASKRQIFLTGTLTNGQSTSIKEILWRSDPKALIEDGFDDKSGMIQWASRYGVLEEIFYVDEGDRGVHTRRRVREKQVKEAPGISPQLIANHLLHKAAFTELGDLGLPLVELKEIPVIIPMTPHGVEYRTFHDELHGMCQLTGNFGPFIPATINYSDQPEKGMSVKFLAWNAGHVGYEYVTAPAAPIELGEHEKALHLVELVKSELAEDRGCVIYTNYTARYGMNEYIQKILAKEGIHSAILSSNISTLDRFEWLEEQKRKGTQVIITNLQNVEVGLDLIYWPTIIYYQLNYNINVVRQSGRRHWRIGQTRECRTYYLIYDGSQQLAQFKTLMNRRSHALLVEGRIDKSELAEYADSRNTLAADLAECISDTDIVEKWKKLASRDIDEKLEIVSENQFEELLQKRMAELQEETLSLCLPIPEKRTMNHLQGHFRKWVAGFNAYTRKKLLEIEDLLLEAIRHKRIRGLHYGDSGIWMDMVGIFGIMFVPDESILDYIYDSLGIQESEVIARVSGDELLTHYEFKLGEVKTERKRKSDPPKGQLQLLFM